MKWLSEIFRAHRPCLQPWGLVILFVSLTTTAQQSDPVEDTSTAQNMDEFVYDPVGRRDPFKPWRPFAIKKAVDPKAQTTSGAAPVIEITDPLLKYEIEQYSVLAIMWDVARPRALVKDPDGKSHLVFQGSRLGRNGGSIRSLREGEIIINESVDVNGEMKNTTKILEVKTGDFSSKIQAPTALTAPNLKIGNFPLQDSKGSSIAPSAPISLPNYFDSVEDANAALRPPSLPSKNSRPQGNQNRSQSTSGQPKAPEAPK